MQKLEIATLNPQDIPEFSSVITAIWSGIQHLYSPTAQKVEEDQWTEESIAQKLASPNYLLLAAKKDEKIVAARVAEFECHTLFLYLSGVLPDYQKQGIGTQMHEFTFQYLREHHPEVHKVWCDTITSNGAGIAILRKLGFIQEAKLENHWYGNDYYLWSYWLTRA